MLKDKGLDGFGAKTGQDAAKNLVADLNGEEAEFDPLMGSWARINLYMAESPGCNGRILECPLCILVADGQPELVHRWLDGCTGEALTYALEKGLIKKN